MSASDLARKLAALSPGTPRAERLLRVADNLDRVNARRCHRCAEPVLDVEPGDERWLAKWCAGCRPVALEVARQHVSPEEWPDLHDALARLRAQIARLGG